MSESSRTPGTPEPDENVEMTAQADGSGTAGARYADRLRRLEGAKWKQVLDVQRPYRWNLRRLGLGRVLEVGCGIGRNLANLDGNAIGVDHNAESVATARERGFTAYTSEEFHASEHARTGAFDSMLLAHVMEHVEADVADGIVKEYLSYVRPGGKVVFITPQEVGYRTDPTHVRFVDLGELKRHAAGLGLGIDKAFSFPFPRPAGKVFAYNEFVLVARVPARTP